MSKDRIAIGVMAKAPVPGAAKTRLIPLVGEVRAADLHRLFLLDTLDAAGRTDGADLFVVCPDEEQSAQLAPILPAGVAVLAQRTEGLMAGLAEALAELVDRGYGAVVLADADSPTLPSERFAEAFEALAGGADVVLGPCDDGGYYLVGARAPQWELFRGSFHRERICRETADRAVELGLRVQLLAPWYDVDEPADLARLAREFLAHPDRAPATSRELRASYPPDYLSHLLPDSRAWTLLETEMVDASPWRTFRRDLASLGLPNDRSLVYTYLEAPRAVFVVPLTPAGQIALVRQYRYPVRNWVWEVPAGSIEPGETSADAARRELAEEIGGECRSLEFVASFRSSSAHMDLAGDYYLASGVTLGPSRPESTEDIELRLFGAEQALAMARRGEMQDGQSALALLAAEPLIRACLGI